MAELKRGSCSNENCQYREHARSIDRMSLLPDELLLSVVVPHLSFKEVAAAAALSRRWRHFWTFARSLDIDGTNSLLKVNFTRSERQSRLDEARSEYVRCVNHVVGLHKESTIDEFRVFFNLTNTHGESIDEWIRFALARKVQRLELDLTDHAHARVRSFGEFYTFPHELFRENLNELKYLKRLSMNYVNVNLEAFELILRNCPLLEDLSVSYSAELIALKITGPFPALKRLEIASSYDLNSFEICDVDLVCLIYEGSNVQFHLRNVPMLVDVSIGGMLIGNVQYIIRLLSRELPNMETLTLDFLEMSPWKNTTMHYPAVEMSNLKRLVVRAHVLQDCDLLQPTELIRVSPCLQRFELQVTHCSPCNIERMFEKIVRPYAQLKEIKFVGYCGLTRDVELVMHFLENANSLEKIEIDPRLPFLTPYHRAYFYDGAFRDETVQNEIDARARAKEQLTKIVPPNITLNIL